jgi:uncharacterized protein (TIGR00730 family)
MFTLSILRDLEVSKQLGGMERAHCIIEQARKRLQQLLDEYYVAEDELRKLEDTRFRVCIFGSARISRDHPTYQEVFRLAGSLAKLPIDVVTGGGPGLMEAANRGVRDARNGHSKSYGLPIDIPSLAGAPNKHLDIKRQHKRFSSRLDEFMRLTHAVVVAPGGIGTLLELMYVWQLLQVGMLERRLVILLGGEFWGGLLSWMREQMLAKAFISPHNFDSIHLVDSIEEAVTLITGELGWFEAARAQVDPCLSQDQVVRGSLAWTAEATPAVVADRDRTVLRMPARRRREVNGAACPPAG